MNSKIIAGVIAVAVIGGVVYVLARHGSGGSANLYSTPASSQNQTTGKPANSTQAPTTSSNAGTTDVAITATDDSASQTSINVTKGTKVNLTFNVSSSGVYHGGLQFKSTDPTIDSGPIATGDSKTVSFVVDKSFTFTPYWYASGVRKDYTIAVNAQ